MRRSLEIIVVAAVCAFVFFYGLAAFGLVGADEPRYAQIAREMLERHDWVTPTLGGTPWLEKPVLYYWSAIISYKIFGVSDWAARVPTAVLTTLMIFAVYAFVLRFRPGSQLNAALMTATAAGVIGFGRGASTDMPLTAMLTIAMLGWLAWYLDGRRRWLAAFYFFAALASLAKGPIAVILCGFVITTFALVRRDWKLVLRTLWLPGIALFVAVALPWYVAVERSTHQFFHVFFVEHNLGRYSTNMFRHSQPFYYYAIVLPLALLPWLIFAVAGFAQALRDRTRDHGVWLFLAIWAALPVLFFSFSGSKLPGYILPAIPAWTLLAAFYVHDRHASETRPSSGLSLGHGAVAAALVAAALISPFLVLKQKPAASAWGFAAGAALVTLIAVAVALRVRGWRAVRLATLVPMLFALGFVVRITAPFINAKESSRPIAREIAGFADSSTRVAAEGVRREIEYGLHFYRNQPVLRYERGEQPAEAHLLLTPPVPDSELRRRLERPVTRLGKAAVQNVDLYWVGPAVQQAQGMKSRR